MNTPKKKGTVQLFEFDVFDEAKQKAADDAASSFSLPLQAVMFQQSGRTCFSTSIPIVNIIKLVQFDPAVRGANDPETHTNRPIMPDHVRTIADYLVDRETYILPALTLNVREPLRAYTYRTSSAVRGAILVIPGNTTFFVTDGQHRLKALESALARRPSLSGDAVAVTLVVEPDIQQIHQDFADAAQVKPIPPSLLTLYNVRDDLSRLTVEIVEEVPFFEGRIEKVGKTVSKRSNNLYTLNHVRVAMAAALTGDFASNAATLRAQCGTLLQTEDSYDEWHSKLKWYFEELSERITEWKIIRDANQGHGTAPDVADLRARFVHFSGTGLTIIGCVGREILKIEDVSLREKKLDSLAREIDWRRVERDGSPIGFWIKASILTGEGQMVTSKYAVGAAVEAVLSRLGLQPQPQVAAAAV